MEKKNPKQGTPIKTNSHLDVLPVGPHAVDVGVDVGLLVEGVVGSHRGADRGLFFVFIF